MFTRYRWNALAFSNLLAWIHNTGNGWFANYIGMTARRVIRSIASLKQHHSGTCHSNTYLLLRQQCWLKSETNQVIFCRSLGSDSIQIFFYGGLIPIRFFPGAFSRSLDSDSIFSQGHFPGHSIPIQLICFLIKLKLTHDSWVRHKRRIRWRHLWPIYRIWTAISTIQMDRAGHHGSDRSCQVHMGAHGIMSDCTGPHGTTPDHAGPHRTTPEHTGPHGTTPTSKRSQPTVSDHSRPQSAIPDYIRPYQTTWD